MLILIEGQGRFLKGSRRMSLNMDTSYLILLNLLLCQQHNFKLTIPRSVCSLRLVILLNYLFMITYAYIWSSSSCNKVTTLD